VVNGQNGSQKVIGGEGREVGRPTAGRVEWNGTTRVELEQKVARLEITVHHAISVHNSEEITCAERYEVSTRTRTLLPLRARYTALAARWPTSG
jgi:hypothetical protein